MGLTELLTLAFIIAKLYGVIDWNWWIIFLPEIIMFIIYFIFLFCALRINKKLDDEWRRFMEDDD